MLSFIRKNIDLLLSWCQRITFCKHYNTPYGATKWLLHNKYTNVFHISVTLIIKVLTEPKCGKHTCSEYAYATV